jgi:Ni/Fe-hydrogenase 1 B-type cytochrome subunit
MRSDERFEVYVWEFPVRLFHWINFLCILTLSVTGFYIGRPFIHAYSADQYVMGWVRFIHFTTAYVFLMSLLIRIYWSFVGNRYASWKAYFPFSARRLREMAQDVKFYLFIHRDAPHDIGHPSLAALTYLVLFLVLVFQLVSGFALYAAGHEDGFIWTLLGGWLLGLLNVQTVRLFHHLNMYFILALAAVHVYTSWYQDAVEKDGLIGSIFSGYKYITGKEIDYK